MLLVKVDNQSELESELTRFRELSWSSTVLAHHSPIDSVKNATHLGYFAGGERVKAAYAIFDIRFAHHFAYRIDTNKLQRHCCFCNSYAGIEATQHFVQSLHDYLSACDALIKRK
mmetsp:Transcript_12775/g.18619  ORF Transcript_12775/g.18619 Transcript_12775/m.18619 type:complete len:115 (+) Transcript_12775:655-999(+)